MQRRNFLKFGLTGSASLLTPSLAFSAQQLSINNDLAVDDLTMNNKELMIALEKRMGFRVTRLDQHSTGLFHAELANGEHTFALYSKDVQQWRSTPQFS